MKLTKEMQDYFQRQGYTDEQIELIAFKDFVGEIRDTSDTERTVVAVVSNDAVDRMGEVLVPEGADLKNYKKNPVVLWAHDYGGLPVAKSLWIKKIENNIVAKIKFATTAFAEDVYQLFKGGFLKAFSVGFIPLEFAEGNEKKGIRRYITKWEMVEHSAVPVPANPQALAIAVKDGKINISAAMQKAIFGDKELPPTKPGKATMEVVAGLEQQLIEANTKLTAANAQLQDLRWKQYEFLTAMQEPKGLVEMTDDEILTKIKEIVVGVISKRTGRIGNLKKEQ